MYDRVLAKGIGEPIDRQPYLASGKYAKLLTLSPLELIGTESGAMMMSGP